jgi:hypothetical protein
MRLPVNRDSTLYESSRARSRSQYRKMGSPESLTCLPKQHSQDFLKKNQNFLGFSLEIRECLSIDSPSLAGKVQGD